VRLEAGRIWRGVACWMEERTREAWAAMRHCFSVGDSAHLSAVQSNSFHLLSAGFRVRERHGGRRLCFSYLEENQGREQGCPPISFRQKEFQFLRIVVMWVTFSSRCTRR
jgi:hypothetical protein